jgi:hypothetical protein
LRRYLKWGLIAIVSLMGAWWLLNAFDPGPRPEVAAALADPAPDPSTADNAYFAMLAFDATDATDIHAKGMELQAYLDGLAARQPDFDGFSARLGKRLEFVGDLDPLCSVAPAQDAQLHRAPYRCLERVGRDSRVVGKLLTDNIELLHRYRSLQTYPRYHDVSVRRHQEPMARWAPLTKAQRLLLSQAALAADAGDLAAAIRLLQGDARFWRAVTVGQDDLLIDKVIGQHCLTADYVFASELIRTQPLKDADFKALATMLSPLSPAERSLAATYRAELRYASDTVHYEVVNHALSLDAAGEDGQGTGHALLVRLAGHFFQYGQFMDHVYDRMQVFTELDAAPPTEFMARRQALPARLQALHSNVLWADIYDPVGNILFDASASADYSGYTARLIDQEGMRRLVSLQLLLKQQRVPPQAVPEFLAHADPALADPYTGRPMRWDPARHTLGFTPGTPNVAGWLPLPVD